MALLFARTDLYLKNPSICTSRICMRINYLFVCLSVCLSVNTYIFKEQHYYILVWPKRPSVCLSVCLFVACHLTALEILIESSLYR